MLNMNKRNEMLILAGVKPVSLFNRTKRKVKKILFNVLFNVKISAVLIMAVLSGIFSPKMGSFFSSMAWLLIYGQEENE
jgi:hypothetical protein